ncbi:GFA family protein [Bradyrhizobium canariense]|uniref:GFA family protein n=1 Tax=Bradyrhizobium canariense TaxID=255045 RepID=UPI001FD9D5A4|nr:GFA family protein [Bradyrhizobium canariense]
MFARSAVAVTGEVREIERTAVSGAVKRKGFCPNCGSPIYNKPDEKPDLIGIYVGTLDDASTFEPSVARADMPGITSIPRFPNSRMAPGIALISCRLGESQWR